MSNINISFLTFFLFRYANCISTIMRRLGSSRVITVFTIFKQTLSYELRTLKGKLKINWEYMRLELSLRYTSICLVWVFTHGLKLEVNRPKSMYSQHYTHVRILVTLGQNLNNNINVENALVIHILVCISISIVWYQ